MLFLSVLAFTFFLLAITLSYFIGFLRRRPSITLSQSKFRILLVFVLMITVPMALAFAPLSQVGEYTSLFELWSESKAAGIFYFLSAVFILLAGAIVPFSTVFYFYSSYRRFIEKLDYEVVSVDSKDRTLKELWEIFSECVNVAGVKASVKLLVPKQELEHSAILDCGIVGRGKNAAMMLSIPFIKLFEEGKLTKEDVKAIFLHELSHVFHNDHFMPLWAMWFVRSKTFTYTIILFLVATFFIFWSAYLAGDVDIIEGLLKTTNIFVLVLIPFLIFRAVIWRLIARIMREREFLADLRSARLYAPDKIASSLKKSVLFPAEEKSPMFSFAGIIHDKHAHKAFKFITGKADWHPSLLDRIEALGQRKMPELEKKKKMPSGWQIIGHCRYYLIVFAGFVVISIAVSEDAATSFITLIGLISSFLFVPALVIESIFPLRFLDKQDFQESLIGLRPLHVFSRFFSGKLWGKIHLNNFLIALAFCTVVALSSFVCSQEVAYLRWHRTFFLEAVLFYFLYCTAFSILLVGVYWSEKKKEERKKEEVPIELL